jgi:hypothetical protein
MVGFVDVVPKIIIFYLLINFVLLVTLINQYQFMAFV